MSEAAVPGPAEDDPTPKFFAVGVAASAGGVQALTTLASALPADLPATLLLAYHQGVAHPSHLVEILRRRCRLTVRNAVDGEKMEPGSVLMADSECHLVVSPGWHLSTPREEPVQFVRPSANRLFSSLAAICGPRAIAVVLSGMGTDGAEGVRAVKAAGGTVIVQEIDSARFPSMPAAAIQTGLADLTLPVDEMPAALERLTRRP
jgi:two-component system chemotaxis response regulator CheB